MHALNAAGVKRWVALSEGQGGTVGWLTVSSVLPDLDPVSMSLTL